MGVWEGLTNTLEKKRRKRQSRKERYTHLNVEFQRIARRDLKKAFLSDQCKEIEENIRIVNTRDVFKKIKYVNVFIVSPSIWNEVMELDAMIFIFF